MLQRAGWHGSSEKEVGNSTRLWGRGVEGGARSSVAFLFFIRFFLIADVYQLDSTNKKAMGGADGRFMKWNLEQ